VSLKPGNYTITAEADHFKTRSETVQVLGGKTADVNWKLEPVTVATEAKLTPSRVFENGSAWTTDKSGWWVHDGQGYSFLRANQGTFIFDILKEEQKGFFRNRTKKVLFVADYRGDDNRIVYTFDGHNISRKIYSGGHADSDSKVPLGTEGNSVYRIAIEITPATIVIRDRNGKVLDSTKRQGAPGKFGFQDEVALSVASVP
jgi:hypothetical protein